MAIGVGDTFQWPAARRVVIRATSQAYDLRRAQLENERNEYLEEWKDITEFVQVRRGRYLVDAVHRGKRRHKKVLHEQGIFASRTCGAGMLAGVSSPSRPWLKLGTPDKELNEFAGVKRWVDQVEKQLYQVFSASNYYHSKQSSYRDMADFGQGPVILDEDYDDVLNCYCSPPGEYMLGVDKKGIVDTIYRDMTRTTKDIVEEYFTIGNIPREIRESWDAGRYDQLWHLVDAIQPNFQMIKGQRGPLGMPMSHVIYASKCSTENNQNVIVATGYRDNPISAPRWDVHPGEVYGDAHPGAIALAGVKSLQVLEKRKGQVVDKLASASLQAPASMDKKVISHQPGAVSYYPEVAGPGGASGRLPIGPLYQVEPAALTVLGNETALLEYRIDKAYFVDLFLATINSDRREVTAREIAEVHEEKLIALGPVLERTHYEGLNRDIKRAFSILARAGALPPPPRELDQQPLKIEYISLLATAQRAIGATGIERFAGFVGNLAAGDPKVLDKWDMDQTVDEYADVTGVPASIVRSDEEVAKLRKDREQLERTATALEATTQGAEAAKVLSEADTGRGSNLLADIIGGQGRLV